MANNASIWLPKGETGDKGPPGDKGPVGDKGPQGDPGEDSVDTTLRNLLQSPDTGPQYIPYNSELTIKEKMQQIVSVLDFGAVADGITDSTEAFQLAFAASIASSGTMYIPAGTFKLTSTVGQLPAQGTSVIGAGAESTILLFDPVVDTTPLFASAIQTGGNFMSGFKVEGVLKKGIFLQTTLLLFNSTFERIELHTLNKGLNFIKGSHSNHFFKVKTIGCNYGVHYEGDGINDPEAFSNINTYEGCRFRSNPYGFYSGVIPQISLAFYDCLYDAKDSPNPTVAGFYIGWASQVLIRGGYMECRNTAGIEINFPADRGYAGQVTIKSFYARNAFTTVRGYNALKFTGLMDVEVDKIYFNGWDKAIVEAMVANATLSIGTISSAVINTRISREGLAQVYEGYTERGTNSNGNYIKFPNGYQICWHRISNSATTISNALMGGFRSDSLNAPFPSNFISIPAHFGAVRDNTAFGCNVAGSTTQWTYSYLAVTSQTAADRAIALFASGFWK